MNMLRKYGHIPDRPGSRRHLLALPDPDLVLPPAFSLVGSPHLRPAYDQLQHGSCVWNALLGVFEFKHHQLTGQFADLSRMFGYRQTMCLENQDPTQDCGCMPADAIGFLLQTGSCTEALWPYTADASGLVNTPPQACFDSAATNKALLDRSLPRDLFSLKAAIFSGNPVLFGIQCFGGEYGIESDFARTEGRVGLPSRGDRRHSLGGHGIMGIGFDDDLRITQPRQHIFGPDQFTTGALLIRNSWGPDWGLEGNFWLPYDFVADSTLADSFWTLTQVE